MRPSGTYFNLNYGRWAPAGVSKGNAAMALSSKSTPPGSTLVTEIPLKKLKL